jgi:hypothetical protein
MKCCVYTRFVFELCYLDIFIEHYLRLGFDKIIVLCHDMEDFVLDESLAAFVEIYEVENRGNRLPNKYKDYIPENYDWVLHVDSDELLVLNKKYRTIHDYINDKLRINSEINVFQFSWLWLHRFELSNIAIKNSLKNILYNYKTMIGYKDIESKQIWVKTMAKVKDIVSISCHTFTLNTQAIVCVNNSVEIFDNDDENTESEQESEMYSDSDSECSMTDDSSSDISDDDCSDTEVNNLVNEDEDEDEDEQVLHQEICKPKKEVYIPRHYRIHLNTYTDSFLLHINSRDIINVFFKGLNIHHSQVQKKKITKLKSIKNLINSMQNDSDIHKRENFTKFIKIVGYKLTFPIECLEHVYRLNLHDYNIFQYKNSFCNFKYYEEYKQFYFRNFMARLQKKYYHLDANKLYRFLLALGNDMDGTFTWYGNNI